MESRRRSKWRLSWPRSEHHERLQGKYIFDWLPEVPTHQETVPTPHLSVDTSEPSPNPADNASSGQSDGHHQSVAETHAPNLTQPFGIAQALASPSAQRDRSVSPGHTPPLPPPTAAVDDIPDLIAQAGQGTAAGQNSQKMPPPPSDQHSSDPVIQSRSKTPSPERKYSVPVSPKTTSGPPVSFPQTSYPDYQRKASSEPGADEIRRDSRLSKVRRSLSASFGRSKNKEDFKGKRTITAEAPGSWKPAPSSGRPRSPGPEKETLSAATTRRSSSPKSTRQPTAIRFSEPPRPDRDTEEHQRVVEQVARSRQDFQRRIAELRNFSPEAMAAYDDEDDPVLADEIERAMLDAKRHELARRNRHRHTPITTPAEDILLTEAQRHTAARVARENMMRERARRRSSAYHQTRNMLNSARAALESNYRLHKRLDELSAQRLRENPPPRPEDQQRSGVEYTVKLRRIRVRAKEG